MEAVSLHTWPRSKGNQSSPSKKNRGAERFTNLANGRSVITLQIKDKSHKDAQQPQMWRSQSSQMTDKLAIKQETKDLCITTITVSAANPIAPNASHTYIMSFIRCKKSQTLLHQRKQWLSLLTLLLFCFALCETEDLSAIAVGNWSTPLDSVQSSHKLNPDEQWFSSL